VKTETQELEDWCKRIGLSVAEYNMLKWSVGVDDRLHLCLPYESTAFCGAKIAYMESDRNPIRHSDHFGCWGCDI